MYSSKSKTNETRVKQRVDQVNIAHELLLMQHMWNALGAWLRTTCDENTTYM